MVKKKITKKSNEPEIDIKFKNMDKLKELDCKSGCGPKNHCSHFWVFGSALAMILSYTKSTSILWAILHGILSWFYILYRSMQIWGWF